jgi:hypothetical protein
MQVRNPRHDPTDPPRPRLGVRQDRPGRVCPQARGTGRRDRLHRRHRQGAGRSRACGHRRCRRHRFPGDHGRAGEDAASAHPWRHPGAARAFRGCRGASRARHRRHRSRGRQPLSVRGGAGARGGLRRTGRDHRHRRPGDDPRRGQEPRQRHGDRRSGRLRRGHRGDGGRQRRDQPETRRALAAKAFARTAAYDSAVSNWLLGETGTDNAGLAGLGGHLRQTLRYGENPHQDAAFYVSAGRPEGLAAARQVQGKELSYNNINDTDAALECVAEFDPSSGGLRHRQACQPVRGGRGVQSARGLSPGAALRSGLGLWRHRGLQPAARRGDGGGRRPDLHRSDHRAGRRSGGPRRARS